MKENKNIPELFGSRVFGDDAMKARLPKDTYKAVKKTIENGTELELDVANVVAAAMKDWAIELGATHYTHWFQPMTGITAEKHEAFISPQPNGKIIMEFGGKELVKGEPDASSFPSGGLRATFEARGYTAWDPTSYAFVKDDTLCIPTAFCSYTGVALDKKTPLMRSIQTLNEQALRILRLFGDNETSRVTTTVGPEQEYFIVSKEVFEKRPDLIHCGRTLFGARPPRGQELEDHYYGTINQTVSDYMKELETELWKLGIFAKTKHNEVAPAQHELAPVFTSVNVAVDHNQLTMELMKSVARKRGLECLLHEKPFANVNGSGKHNNWSMSTDKGVNLLEPGDNPRENARFLLFLSAIIKAVDEYQDLLRLTVATAGNDHRLGANEAPPAIVSIFLGEDLKNVLDSIKDDKPYSAEKQLMEVGVTALPRFPKDSTDRNRTSPFAFTGNKFEFRMLGSSLSISGPNFVLNTIVAEILSQFADKLEKAGDFRTGLNALIKETIKAHERIVFNGNGYAQEWQDEAAERGLSNFKTTVESLPTFVAPKNVEVLTKHKVLSKEEIFSRYEILLENYTKTIHIEALTMIDMVKREITPAVYSYEKELAELIQIKSKVTGYGNIDCTSEADSLQMLSKLSSCMAKGLKALEQFVKDGAEQEEALQKAKFYREKVFFAMNNLRGTVDELETLVPKKYWPFPNYAEMLYSVL